MVILQIILHLYRALQRVINSNQAYLFAPIPPHHGKGHNATRHHRRLRLRRHVVHISAPRRHLHLHAHPQVLAPRDAGDMHS
ncbi:hypothetical protein VTG60DRAFT_3441 [Thermothelomyces hinnuleus]